MANMQSFRILDASANRALEGLRVVEDYLRFVLDDSHLTGICKQLRHDLASACSTLDQLDRAAMRDTLHDVGTQISTEAETQRIDAWDVCRASFERTKQSLRSLEEYGKVPNPTFAAEVESLRYRLYTLEKAVVLTCESQTQLANVRLCVLVDGRDSLSEFAAVVQPLLKAGVGMIQLREKTLDDRRLLELAQTLVSQAAKHCSSTDHQALIIVNDRPDIAVAAGADGVHLGQDDLRVQDARAILGPRKLIGISTHSIEQAHTAVLDGANYLGAGPTFPSTTKQFDQFPGLDYLRQVAEEISLPTFAIGGIDQQNLPQVLECGITRVAVGGAVTSAANVGETASVLLKALSGASIL